MELIDLEKSISSKLKTIDFVITAVSIVACIYAYKNIEYGSQRNMIIGALALIAFIYALKAAGIGKNKATQDFEAEKISNIALVNEENEIVRDWDMFNATSMLIGKSTGERHADIDLTETAYEALVDDQHAVMNFASGCWYIEDLHSKNGIRIQKNEDGSRYILSKDKPCKVFKGDILYIAETKLLIR